MTVAMVAAALAAWWAWPVRARGRLSARAVARSRGHSTPSAWVGLGGGVVVVAGLVAATGVGPGAGAAVAIVGATVVLVLRRRGRAAQAWRQRQAVSDACGALAAEVAVGQAPVTALATVAAEFDVLADGAAQVALGGDPCAGWRGQAVTSGLAGLGRLAAAWEVCVTTGAPLAPSLDAVAQALRDDQELAHTVDQELAAARATGRVMALLPVVGLLLGYAMGGDPVGFLLGTGWGQACLVVGVALACAGLLWSERLVDEAGRW